VTVGVDVGVGGTLGGGLVGGVVSPAGWRARGCWPPCSAAGAEARWQLLVWRADLSGIALARTEGHTFAASSVVAPVAGDRLGASRWVVGRGPPGEIPGQRL
jgi:hypothetical protein